MAKRRRTTGGSVTGGTGDVKPQIYTISTGVAPDTDDYIVNQVTLPVPRIGQMQKKAMVFELLRVDWYIGVRDLGDSSSTKAGFLSFTELRDTGDTATAASLENDLLDPSVFAAAILQKGLTTSGATVTRFPISINTTDANGNGILIATDRIFINGADIGGTTAANYVAKLYYRMVNVGITEYVGIVQSQQ